MSRTEYVLVMYTDEVISEYSHPIEKLMNRLPNLENKSFTGQSSSSYSTATLCHLFDSPQPLVDTSQCFLILGRGDQSITSVQDVP